MSGNYLYDRIVPTDHLLRKINQVVDFSFVHDLVKDRYTPDFGRPAEDPEFMLRLCLLQYLYGDSDRQVIENARVNLAYKYFLGLAVDEETSMIILPWFGAIILLLMMYYLVHKKVPFSPHRIMLGFQT